MYFLSEAYPELLCPDRIISKVKPLSFIAMNYVFILCLFSGIFKRPKSCFYGQNKNPSGLYFVMLVSFSFFLIFLPLLICSVWLNFYGINMIIWSSTNGTVYRCELNPEDSDAHLIIFPPINNLSNLDPEDSNAHLVLFPLINNLSNYSGQICEFWPVNSLCGPSSCIFRHLPQLGTINGSRGAYRCQESSPEGHDLCLSFLKSTQTYSLIQAICAFISVILLSISLVCIKIRKHRKKRSLL